VQLATEHTKTVSVISTTSTAEPVRRHCFSSLLYINTLHTDLRALGQTTKLERSTLEQVRARIALLREKTKEATSAKAFDFDQRLAEVKAKELAIREQKKAAKQAEKEKFRLEIVKNTVEDDEMAQMMGFGGFGSTKK
jgi:U4/U6.U5 tri-snRNP component SNU23